MRIAVLDGYTLNPGDLSWEPLRALGPCTIYERTPPDQVLARAQDSEIVLTNKTILDRALLQQLAHLQYIGVLATGYNVVDTEAARELGIHVTNIPTYGTSSVAQMTMAHLLNLALHVGHHARTVAEGCWSRSPDFCYWDYPLVELGSLTMGIVGFGRIGRAVAALCTALGMGVLAYDPQVSLSAPAGVRSVDLDQIFRESDVISLHCPLTPQTRGIVNADRLAMMKSTAWLINTSRGPLVDEAALAEALDTDRIAGAGLDVLSREPPPSDHPLLRAKNCFITPHIAWATKSARQRLLDIAVENIRTFLEGHPLNVVT